MWKFVLHDEIDSAFTFYVSICFVVLLNLISKKYHALLYFAKFNLTFVSLLQPIGKDYHLSSPHKFSLLIDWILNYYFTNK